MWYCWAQEWGLFEDIIQTEQSIYESSLSLWRFLLWIAHRNGAWHDIFLFTKWVKEMSSFMYTFDDLGQHSCKTLNRFSLKIQYFINNSHLFQWDKKVGLKKAFGKWSRYIIWTSSNSPGSTSCTKLVRSKDTQNGTNIFYVFVFKCQSFIKDNIFYIIQYICSLFVMCINNIFDKLW